MKLIAKINFFNTKNLTILYFLSYYNLSAFCECAEPTTNRIRTQSKPTDFVFRCVRNENSVRILFDSANSQSAERL